ncbi:Expressed sequence AI182371 [Apodemus speciosus]|uniref:Expressed sequence AI182371 n=1 Tax=Apodemus speciosus TaxID=105296 RepID=A0ABQ0EHK9_APOSI
MHWVVKTKLASLHMCLSCVVLVGGTGDGGEIKGGKRKNLQSSKDQLLRRNNWITHIISIPTVFRIGVPENVTVQAHGHTEAFDTNISVKSYPDENVHYFSGTVNLSPENKFQNTAILTIQAKQLLEGQNSFSNVYLEVMSKHFSTLEIMPIIHDNGSLYVATDKDVYTPQQPVKVGVYSVGAVLEPVTRETVLTFIDPEGVEVDIIEGNNHTGSTSFPNFEIPSNPKHGRWTVKAKYRDNASTAGTTYFEVKEHDKAYRTTVMATINLKPVVERREEAHDVCDHQPTECLKQKIEEQASKYKHRVLKKCCYDGARHVLHETCEQRAARVKIGPLCVKAFTLCCTTAQQILANSTFRHIHLSYHKFLAELSSERLHPAATLERDAETHSQTLDGERGALEELGEEQRDLKRTGTPQEHQQSQLTWTLGGSQSLNYQPKNKD